MRSNARPTSRRPAGAVVAPPSAGLTAVLAAAVFAWGPGRAAAYTTRVHISLANDVRQALVRSGDGTIRLAWSEYAVTLPPEDAEAIVMEPLAFRAGAVGPDNMVFPGLTDATHGAHQDPFRQCQLLYEDAITRAERAYALGCFLHGASDAVVHHLVNHFTGETFTLTPLSSARAQSFDNVVGHITSEGLIQDALLRADPSRFGTAAMQHDIPRSFVLRNYYATDAPLWQRMSEDAREKLERARMAMPGASLPTLVGSAGLGSYEYLVLAPVFVAEADRSRAGLRGFVLAEIADMQDPTSSRGRTLRVSAGPDGRLGTRDDTTACTSSCASLAARYHGYVRLLEPRMDAGGRTLPSAFDKVVDELGDDLTRLLPALLEVVENLSRELNSPLSAEVGGLDLDPARLRALFAPLDAWLASTTRID